MRLHTDTQEKAVGESGPELKFRATVEALSKLRGVRRKSPSLFKGSENFALPNIIMLIQALIVAQELLSLLAVGSQETPDIALHERNEIKGRWSKMPSAIVQPSNLGFGFLSSSQRVFCADKCTQRTYGCSMEKKKSRC